MQAYRFNIVATGFGESPDEAFNFVLTHLPTTPEATLDREIHYDQIQEEHDLQDTLSKMLALYESADEQEHTAPIG
jgi:hypothetical protein